MLLEQRHNTPAHVPPWRTRQSWGARSWQNRRRRAGRFQEAVIPVLHVLEHLQQERAFFTRGLAVARAASNS